MSSSIRFFAGTLCLVFFLTLQGVAPGDAQAGRSARVRAPKTSAKVKTSHLHRLAAGRPVSRSIRQQNTLHRVRRATPTRLKTKTKSKVKTKTISATRRLKTKNSVSATRRQAAKKSKSKAPGQRSAKKASKAKAFAKAINSKITRLKQHPTAKRLAKRYTRFSAATTRRLDSWQSRAPPWLARTMNALRTYSLTSLAAFSVTHLKRDAKFLGTYFAANSIISYGVLPAAISFGMNPLTSAALNALSTPVTLAVLVFRHRQLKRRAGESITLAQSATAVLQEYRDFAKTRRANVSAQAMTHP